MTEDENGKPDRGDLLRMTAQVAAAYVGNNTVSPGQLSELIKTIHSSMSALDAGSPVAASGRKPMVPIKKSVTAEYIVCLEDGKKLKMLKRHLRTAYKLTPEQYRLKWGLAPNYPMVAPNYAAQRSAFAKKIGLGRKPGHGRRAKVKK
ncbi:MAG: MucR family transcriptional regulator [Pseudomonadota bacterium]